jgi:acyl carrier protein
VASTARVSQPTTGSVFAGVVAAVRSTAKGQLPQSVEPHHCFLTDLGFDSMSIALLALALEDQFESAILLDGWIAQCSDPATLTVQSLCDYVHGVLSQDDATVLR